MVCWTEGHSSSLAIDQSPPLVPCHVGLPFGQLTTRQVASIRANKGARRKPEPFCQFILSDILSLDHILLAVSPSPHSRERTQVRAKQGAAYLPENKAAAR